VRVIAIINQKGGVGKTTTTSNLSHALAWSGKKVTAIDLDPQGHLAVSLGVTERGQGMDEVLLNNADIEDLTLKVRDNLQLVLPGTRLQEIEQLTEGGVQRGDLLRKALQNRLQDQDFVFIDCPPSSGMLVANVLFATDEILIPMAGDFLALQGLSHLMGTLKKFERTLKINYKKRLLMSRYNSTRRISKQVLNTLLEHFPGQVMSTLIRETALLAECPGYGKTIIEYRPGSRSARDFRGLAQDLLEGRVM
jgi:chromosome partitioning protein